MRWIFITPVIIRCINYKRGNWQTIRLLSWTWDHHGHEKFTDTQFTGWCWCISEGTVQYRKYFIGLRITRKRHWRINVSQNYPVYLMARNCDTRLKRPQEGSNIQWKIRGWKFESSWDSYHYHVHALYQLLVPKVGW